MKKHSNKTIYLVMGIVILLIECFAMNFRYWESCFFPSVIKPNHVEISSGIQKTKEGYYQSAGSDQRITISMMNQRVENLQLNFKTTNTTQIKVAMNFSDEGWSGFYQAGEADFVSNNLQLSTIRTHFSENAKAIQLRISSSEPWILTSILMNVRVQFSFSFFRVAFMILLASLFMVFYNIKNKKCGKLKKPNQVVYLVALIHCLFFGVLVNSNPDFKTENNWGHLQEYQILAQALKKGQVYIDEAPSIELQNLENPYDRSQRDGNAKYLWDYAYFQGKYYVYFGVVPAVLFYLPFHMITQGSLHNYIPIFLSLVMFILGVYFLFEKLRKKYFNQTPQFFSLLLGAVTICGSGGFFIARRPDLYSLPIILGLAFTTLGILCWFKAKVGLDHRWLLIGSIFMALVIGCRPQLAVASFFALVLFWDELKQVHKNKNIQKSFLIAILPYLLIGGALAWYNYVRFGSLFDFGSNYNLTTNDMTKRGIVLDRLPMGLFRYLFQMPVIQSVFPFISATNSISNYYGMTIWEPMFGGLFSCNIILWINLALIKLKSIFQHKMLWSLCVTSLVCGFIIVCADIEMAGILQRYLADFSFFFFFSASIICFTLLNHSVNKSYWQWVCWVIFLLSLLSLGYSLLLFLVPDSSNISITNPQLYNQLRLWLDWLR